MNFQEILSSLNQHFTFYVLFPVILSLGFFLTIRLKGLQLTQLRRSLQALLASEKGDKEGVSNYQALSAVIAGNLGTGNISGMAVALGTGGPGALVWMWVMAFLGSIIQYASCVLSVKYRIRNESGEYVGGPMYYLSQGLGLKKVAIGFAVFTLLGALTVGNFAQVNSIVLPLKAVGFDPFLMGVLVAVASALVMLGGVQRIAKAASSIVPFMALLYLGSGCFILSRYTNDLIPALEVLLKSAFQGSSFAGGVLGFSVVKAISTGFERGIFATDAGTGIVPILQAGARTKEAVTNGLITLVAPFFVMLICSMTGLILIVTGAFENSGFESTNMVVFAFQQVFGPVAGMSIVVLTLSLFAYTTIIAWGGCAEKAAEFLWDKKKAKLFLYLYLVLIPVGAIANVQFVWVLADLSISLMLITNLVGIMGLFKEVIAETRQFFIRMSVSKRNS